MSCHRTYRTSSAFNAGADGACCWARARTPWRPLELVAMILAFILFWPLGLAILFTKIWRSKTGDERDLFTFAREQSARFCENFGFSAHSATTANAEGWRGPGFMRSSGNAAFDDWRESELARLEAERRKLAEAEREFSEHIDQLRRARDRDEFDAFMRTRKGLGDAPSA